MLSSATILLTYTKLGKRPPFSVSADLSFFSSSESSANSSDWYSSTAVQPVFELKSAGSLRFSLQFFYSVFVASSFCLRPHLKSANFLSSFESRRRESKLKVSSPERRRNVGRNVRRNVGRPGSVAIVGEISLLVSPIIYRKRSERCRRVILQTAKLPAS